MKVAVYICVFLIGVVTIEAYSQNGKLNAFYENHDNYKSIIFQVSKAKRLTRPLLIRGYIPKNRRSAYYQPSGVMTAYAHGDMITANSFMGEEPQLTYYEPETQNNNNNIPYDNNGGNNIQHSNNNIPHNNNHEEPQEGSASDFDLSTNESTEDTIKEQVYKVSTTEKPLVAEDKKKDEEEDDDDDNDYWPFNKKLRGFPSYNAFFPIMIGGYTNGRERRTDQGGYPGSATAIANSFSTGKGGVASSHATAYGDPYLSTLLRNGNGLRKKPNSELQE